jgi:hypothetical protein
MLSQMFIGCLCGGLFEVLMLTTVGLLSGLATHFYNKLQKARYLFKTKVQGCDCKCHDTQV